MLEVEEALAIILRHITVLPSKITETDAALGHVAAENIEAASDLPSFDNSAMDGYALRASDTAEASFERPVALKVTQTLSAGGRASMPINLGEAARILTGAPMPDGADAVVAQELVERNGDAVTFRQPAENGKHIRFRGEDVRRGDIAIARGRLIRPAEIGLLTALGITRIAVIPRPRVAILATGDELIPAGAPLPNGRIYDSNAHTLAAQVECAGGIPIMLGIAADDAATTEARIRAGFDADLLVISGGVSVGDRDCVKDALAKLGLESLFWRVRMKPGKPLLFGLLGALPVLGVPGNPAASITSFEHFGVPAIFRLRGVEHPPYHVMNAVVDVDLSAKKDATTFVRVSLRRSEGILRAAPTGSQSGGIMSSLVRADGYVILAPGANAPRAGETVEVRVAHDRVI